jgi:hypothetical protein
MGEGFKMTTRFLHGLAGCGLIAGTLGFSDARADWHRAFVIEWHEPAFYYGAKEGISAPGTDCPKGTNPEMDWRKILKTSWRSDAEVDRILNPEDPQRPLYGGLRGPNKENVYEQPWSVPDPGLVGVSGNLAFGFNLDGNEKTGFKGLTGLDQPTGERGIDNEYYRAIGCFKAWRGPAREGHHAKYVNDGMRDGRYTIVVVASGTGADWRNDNNVKLGFYLSKDKMVKDANGDIARDYTFRINPDKTYQAVVDARTVNGVIERTEPGQQIITRSVDSLPLFLKDARVRFSIDDNGKLYGFIGGYRSIDDYYYEWAGGGAIFELTMHINVPAYWYALQRSADGHFDTETGRYTTISTAYRFYGVPAFAVTPDGQTPVTTAQIFEGKVEQGARSAFAINRTPARGGTQAQAPSQQANQSGGSGRVGGGGRFVNYYEPPVIVLPKQPKAPPSKVARTANNSR